MVKNEIKKMLDGVKVVLLDLDGTIYLGNNLIGNVVETLSKLRKAGKKLVYLTNNSSRSDKEYRKKLGARGILDERDDVYTSARATIEYLNAEHKGKAVYLVGTAAVQEDFINAGINLTDENNADIAVLSYDTTLDFKKIRAFDVALKRGALYVATHPDVVCPAEGYSMPDVGSFIEMFKKSSGRSPDVIIGKPYDGMGKAVVARYNVLPGEVIMVGDRLYTDMAFAVNSGFNSMLVLSGETTKEMYDQSGMKLSVVFDSVNDWAEIL